MEQSEQGFEARRLNHLTLVKKVQGGEVLSPSEQATMIAFERELKKSGRNLSGILPSVEAVEEYSGFKQRTIYAAVKDEKLTRQSDGSFLQEDVDQWLSSKNRLPKITPGNNSDDDKDKGAAAKEELRYRTARADHEELKVAKLKGEQIEVAEAQRNFVARSHEFSAAMTLFSRRCAHKIGRVAGIPHKEVAEILDAECVALLKTLSRKVEIHVD